MIKGFKYFLYSLLASILIYLAAALILENIFTGEKKLYSPNKHLVFVSSGKIHTEFILPVRNSLFDWTRLIPVELVTSKIRSPEFISIGWGSKDFYFKIKTWDNFKLSVFLKIIFFPGESALHVEYAKNLDLSQMAYPLYLTDQEYLELVSFIKDYFVLDAKGKVQKLSDFSYYETDKFFKSHHSYNSITTCNVWTQKGLERINARRPLWSPSKYGIENAGKSLK